MGLAIINQLANYTLERKAQNVIPVDESKRVYLTNVTNFSYEYAGNGIYRLKSLNIGSATLPYVYALAFTANLSGAEIDPISGVVTIGNDFTGGNLKVVINPVYDQYYPLTSGEAYQANTTILNPLTPDSSSVVPYNNLTITGFSYSTNTIGVSGGTSVTPSLNYSYTKVVNGLSTTVSNTGGTKEYTMHSISASGATVNTNTGVVNITANDTQVPKVFVVQAKVTVDDTYQTEVAKITQAAAETPTVTYTYEFSNVSLSYSGTPVAAAGNTNGLYPELSYELTKRGSDNSTESISASSIVYSVQGSKPNGVELTASNGKVTFEANATDDFVLVTIQATLTAPDGTEELAIATLTQNNRTLNSISFKAYNGASAINITTGTTINKSEISVNLIYDVGENGTGACTSIAVGGAMGTLESSHQFTEAGTYPMRIYHGSDLYVDVLVTVTALTKAYIVSIPEDPYSSEASAINISNDKTVVTVPLKVNVMKLNTQSAPEEVEMTFEDYATTLNLAKESYNSPIITFSTNKAYDNLPSKTPSTNGELIYNFNESNYVYDATNVESVSITHTTDSGKDVTYSIPESLHLNAISETTGYFEDANIFTAEEINDTFISNNSWITKIPSSSSSFHISSSSSPREGKIYLSDHGVVYKLTKAGDYYFKCSSPTTSNCAFAIISIPSSLSLKVHNNYQNYYTIDGINVKYFYPDSRTLVTYVHHTPTSGYDTYLLESGSDSTAFGLWYVLTPNNNN